MAFIQIMEYTTASPQDVERVAQEWEQATEGKRTARRLVRTKHRDQPDRYCDMVFFDSYEAAVENSQLPETQEFAKRQQDLVGGDIAYIDLDVLEDRTL